MLQLSFGLQREIKEYYKQNEQHIVNFSHVHPNSHYDAYPFDWPTILTPIERDAWCLTRIIGNLPLYPQYPILNYRVDFANPKNKIIVECDGKDYHDIKKDKGRDEMLWEHNWKVFRIKGSELYRDTPEIERDEYDGEVDLSSLRYYYLNSAEGVLRALKAIYFGTTTDILDMYERWLQVETLNAHSLINYEIDYN